MVYKSIPPCLGRKHDWIRDGGLSLAGLNLPRFRVEKKGKGAT